MTALRVLVDEKLAERAEVLGEKFRTAVRAINSPLVKTVRGKGLLNAVVINEDESVRGRSAWQLCLLLKSRGVLAKPTHVNMFVFPLFFVGYHLILSFASVRFAPPLVISEEDLLKAVEVLRQSLVDLDVVSNSSPDYVCLYQKAHSVMRSWMTFRVMWRARKDTRMW
jgi:ornithine--oxo-acid transaminase